MPPIIYDGAGISFGSKKIKQSWRKCKLKVFKSKTLCVMRNMEEQTMITYPAIWFRNLLLGMIAISSHTRLFVWKSSVRRV